MGVRMNSPRPDNITLFAPAERASVESLRSDAALLDASGLLTEVFDQMPHWIAVANEFRQIVFANRPLRYAIGTNTSAIGLRPGEALGCKNAKHMEGGCGTAEACRYCGTVNAILENQLSGVLSKKQARITFASEGSATTALELSVTASTLQLTGRNLTLLTLVDISDSTRRRALERVFFHDMINSAGGLLGMIEFARMPGAGNSNEVLGYIEQFAGQLLQEILFQKQLLDAENGDLSPVFSPVESTKLLTEAIRQMEKHPSAQDRTVRESEGVADMTLVTDATLARRVLINMIKNGLEATTSGGIVTAGCDDVGDHARFWVRNPGTMEREAQLRIFQRSFSTKGTGRGLGTYSMKLLGERYLGGVVTFETSMETGTVFSFQVPKQRPEVLTNA